MKDYAIDEAKAINGVDTCFLIEATPTETGGEMLDKEEIKRRILEGEDISSLTNSSNISPFRTVLFPNNETIMDTFMDLILDNEERDKKGEKPIYPIINLNRFEEPAPEAYFRRYTKDGDGVKEGDWIIASGEDEFLPEDILKRKVFRTIWVTSVCKTVDGKDIPTENVTRKALRAWANGMETDTDKGKMMTPVKLQLEIERKKAEGQKAKEAQTVGDESLISEFEGKTTKSSARDRRRR